MSAMTSVVCDIQNFKARFPRIDARRRGHHNRDRRTIALRSACLRIRLSRPNALPFARAIGRSSSVGMSTETDISAYELDLETVGLPLALDS
jgi:hypothetical protein